MSTDSFSAPNEVAGGRELANSAGVNAGRLVARNMLALVASQFVTTPVSILVNAMLARRLGASDFGAIYLATTILTVGFLLVEWGGQAQVAAEVARDRSSAGEIFGTGVVLRVVLAAILLLLIAPLANVMAYDATVRVALVLCGIKVALASLGNLCSSIVRGFERMNWYARANVIANLTDAAVVIPVLLLGGGLRAALSAQAVAAGMALLLQIFLVFKLKIGRPTIRWRALHLLLGGGFSFLLLDLVLKLQPSIDAAFLSRLTPPETMGWYSASNRMVGVLIFPATTLSFALYPTLARLWREDRATYHQMVRLGLRAVAMLGVFAAAGTMIFADLIVGLIYGAERYGPAAGNLSILAGYILLVYTSIIVSSAICAVGKQLRWALAQSFCLLVSVSLDPILIPYFQGRRQNGSLGVCVSVVTAEVAMVAFGLRLVPKGTVDKSLLITAGRCLLASLAMVGLGRLMHGHMVLAIPSTVVVYFGLLWLLRELDSPTVELVRSLIVGKLAARQTVPPPPKRGPLLG